MTIALPYRDDLRNGLELMFALRSIEKYLTGWSDVVIIGDPPKWYKGRSISCEDLPARKEYNTYHKLLVFCDQYDGEDFIYWNDDHFLLKPLDISEIKYWHNGPLTLDGAGSARNRQAKANTVELYEETKERYQENFYLEILGDKIQIKPLKNFDIHVPIIFNKKSFKAIFENQTQELIIKSLYCFNAIMDSQSKFMSDCKLQGDFTEEHIHGIIANRFFFSTGTMLGPGAVNVLKELYPNKSRFED